MCPVWPLPARARSWRCVHTDPLTWSAVQCLACAMPTHARAHTHTQRRDAAVNVGLECVAESQLHALACKRGVEPQVAVPLRLLAPEARSLAPRCVVLRPWCVCVSECARALVCACERAPVPSDTCSMVCGCGCGCVCVCVCGARNWARVYRGLGVQVRFYLCLCSLSLSLFLSVSF